MNQKLRLKQSLQTFIEKVKGYLNKIGFSGGDGGKNYYFVAI